MKLSNKAARFGWWFSACFLLICAVFTYILIRDGLARADLFTIRFRPCPAMAHANRTCHVLGRRVWRCLVSDAHPLCGGKG